MLPFWLFFAGPLLAQEQSKTDINALIDHLSWESIHLYNHADKTGVNYKTDTIVEQLVNIGYPVVNSLLDKIREPEKTVIIHFILLKIITPVRPIGELVTVPIYKDCNNLIGEHYVFAGVIWENFVDHGFSITKKEVDKIFEYWYCKTVRHKNAYLKDNRLLLEEVRKSDKINYPCNYSVENNSSEFSLSKLARLIGKKRNDSKIEDAFAFLGRDSLESHYDDCNYVTFEKDGIEFLFNERSELTYILLYPPFEGELKDNKTIFDSKASIEKNFGKPIKFFMQGDQKSCHYKFKKRTLIVKYDPRETIQSIMLH